VGVRARELETAVTGEEEAGLRALFLDRRLSRRAFVSKAHAGGRGDDGGGRTVTRARRAAPQLAAQASPPSRVLTNVTGG